MCEKDSKDMYQPHPLDAGDIHSAAELRFGDFAKLATMQENYLLPSTARRGAAVTLLAELTLPLTAREAAVGLARLVCYRKRQGRNRGTGLRLQSG